MNTRVLFVFATPDEAEILEKIPGIIRTGEGFRLSNCLINSLVTGIGGISTAWGMKLWLSNNNNPDLAINAGIAGTYSNLINIGDVVMPVTDCFADLGIEFADGTKTLSEAGMMDPDEFPFEAGIIHSKNIYTNRAGSILRKVNGITVNTCSGTTSTIEKLKNKFNPDIETMEGATFFYICSREKIPFLSVRAISNKVEPRNRDSWNIPLALENLTKRLGELLLMLD
jgi:futalosine hydrolase